VFQTQTVDFPAPATLLSGPGAVSLTATATSGLPVTLALVSGACTLEGAELIAPDDTTCLVMAGQPGDAAWAPAESVTREIRFVSPADDIVSMVSPLAGRSSLAIDVLSNDPSGLTVESTTTGVRGSTTLGTGGVVSYTPPLTFHGVDEFSYEVRDALGRTARATVWVDVANLAPTVELGDVAQLATTTRSVRVSATDPNDDDLTLLARAERHVDAVIDGDRLRITPDRTVSGWTSVTVRASDGAGGVGTAVARSLVTPLPVDAAYRRLVDDGTRVSWPAAATSGARYRVLVDGESACVTATTECVLDRVLGPDFTVEVQVLGHDGTVSSKVAADARGHGQVLFATVYFRPGDWVLAPSERRALATVARKIRHLGFHDAHVSGYTDSDGGAAYNLDLSRRRTQGAADYLLRTRGIESHQAWFGYDDPVAPNDSDAGKSLNRRVEILVSY
jgi:outer membrane protein OmpA-like peptidoglycan-associated protein